MIRILLLEDDRIMESAVKLQLRVLLDEEYEISSFSNMTNATEFLAHTKCDLIISDLNLPDSKGNETLQALNHYSKKSLVIFMSGTAEEIESFDHSKYPNTYFVMKDMEFNESMYKILSKKLQIKSI